MVSSVDQNGDGCIDVDEFINLMKRRVTKSSTNAKTSKKSYQQELREAFSVFGNNYYQNLLFLLILKFES